MNRDKIIKGSDFQIEKKMYDFFNLNFKSKQN